MKRKASKSEVLEPSFDLTSRIGGSGRSRPDPAAPEIVRRVDGPIESDRAARERPTLTEEEAAPRPSMTAAPEAPARPTMIGENEAPNPVIAPAPPPVTAAPAAALPEREAFDAVEPLVASVREAPLSGEMDLVVTPLATPDDWHHFELALRRLPGVGPLRIEYYRAGILKLRLGWSGQDRFAQALANVPGYRVGILGEDRTTVQIRVVRA
jgi:hypothetical protein